MSESKIGNLNVHDSPMETAQHIITAIADYDEGLYEELMCKRAVYPNRKDIEYRDGTANYDNDVDWAELHSLIGALQYMSERYYKERSDVE